MAYTDPTIEDFRARFPEFADAESYPDATVTLLIDEAKRSVDDTWTEGDYPLAIMYLVAHFMALFQQAQDAGGTGDVTQFVSSVRFADRSVTFATPSRSSAVSQSTLGQTSYGLAFDDLLQRNIPAVLVV